MQNPACKKTPRCELAEIPLESVALVWDGPAVGRKAVAFPAARRIYLERRFWDSLPSVQARQAILFHEWGHVCGACCEPCADFWAGHALNLEGARTARDARRALLARLDNRDPKEAERNLAAGFGADDSALVNLKRQTVTGYREGKAFSLEVYEVAAGHFLAADAARAWLAAVEEALAAGVVARVESAFRDNARQTALYQGWKEGKPGFNPAEKPGHSAHQDGTAVDGKWESTTDREKFAPIAAKHGFTRPVAGEPWHFVHRGGVLSAPVAGAGGALLLLLAGLALAG